MSNDGEKSGDSTARTAPTVYHNLCTARLVEEALRRGEGDLTSSGALNAITTPYTGRTPKDKFIVDDASVHDTIWWGNVNQPLSPNAFRRLRDRALEFAKERDTFVFDGYAGADPAYRLPVRVISLHAWQSLFSRQLFVEAPAAGEAPPEPEFTVIHVPDFVAIPERDSTRSGVFVILSFTEKMILIGGTQYAGEIKKSIFTVMNYLLPHRGVLPMHCSANIGQDGDTALFFGLSGTGKTTLSADPGRRLIGDDEHGWSDNGVFNFEGGCYAECIRLSEGGEPQIWNSIRFGAVLENVVIDPDTRMPDFDDESLTENTRAAYPLEFIPHADDSGMGGHPKNILFLAADASGVLPPISKLSREQAMYHFLSGYTSKVAGTETGVGKAPQPEFSACFALPFLPLPPSVYARMLGEKLYAHNAQCWLVNTGWTGGPYGVGKRMDLGYTRAIVNAVLEGSLRKARPFVPDPTFGTLIPQQCPGLAPSVLQPRATWRDPADNDRAAQRLAAEFRVNFSKLENVDPKILVEGGPREQCALATES